MRILCHFRGCKGVIDLNKELRELVELHIWSERKDANKHKNCNNCAWKEDRWSKCRSRRARNIKRCNEWQFDVRSGPFPISWLTHTIMCPDCCNPVGSIDINASFCVEWDVEETNYAPPKKEKAILFVPGNKRGKTIKFIAENGQVPNKYLKKWAQNPRRRKRKNSDKN